MTNPHVPATITFALLPVASQLGFYTSHISSELGLCSVHSKAVEPVSRMTENNQSVRFAGYKWAWFAGKDVADQNMKAFSESVDWDLVRSYASSLRDGSKCVIDPAVALGGRHLVRIIRFEDGPQWIARLRTTSSADDDALLKREVDCLELVKARTSVPVPKVFGHQSTAQSKIGAPLMLMECIPGNVGMDLNFDFIPSEHKSSFFEAMARCQVSRWPDNLAPDHHHSHEWKAKRGPHHQRHGVTTLADT